MIDEIHNVLGRYLADEVSVAELQVSLPDGWDMDQSGDVDARRLALQIMGNLAEFFNGDLAEDDLRSRLTALMPPLKPQWFTYGPVEQRGSSATEQVIEGALG